MLPLIAGDGGGAGGENSTEPRVRVFAIRDDTYSH
jgi:hypothetical protein